jgi:hypothetical protein
MTTQSNYHSQDLSRTPRDNGKALTMVGAALFGVSTALIGIVAIAWFYAF